MGRLQRDCEFPVCERVALKFRSSCLFSPFLRIFSSLKTLGSKMYWGLSPEAFPGKLTQNDCGYQVQLSLHGIGVGVKSRLRSPATEDRSRVQPIYSDTRDSYLAGLPIERVSIFARPPKRENHREALRTVGALRDKNNWKRIWLTPGAAIRSFFCKVGYARGTRKGAAQQLVHLQQERVVPGVGVEPT